MKTLFITDKSTGLCSALFKKENILIIKDEKNLLKAVFNNVKHVLDKGFNIVYLTTSFNYKKLSIEFNKFINSHPNNYIQLINIDNLTIGKNSLTYKLLSSLDLESTINKYNLHSELLINKTIYQANNLSYAFN